MALLWSQGQLLADSTDSHPGFGLHRTEEGEVGSRGPPVLEGGWAGMGSQAWLCPRGAPRSPSLRGFQVE